MLTGVCKRSVVCGHAERVEMTESVNRLSDFPADRFLFMAFCDCGHQAARDHSTLPAQTTMPALRAGLRCRACGANALSVLIVWQQSGGFEYRDHR